MRDVKIIGVGMTKFGKFADKTESDLGQQACLEAISDAGIDMRKIEAAYCGHVFQGHVMGQRVITRLGIAGIPVTNCENYCCSGATALREGWMAIQSGMYDVVLAFGVEKMYGKVKSVIAPDIEDIEGDLGLMMAALYAMRGRRHMEQYGTTREQIALVSVKNHKMGCLNPRAQHRREITLEEVLNSRPIADPFTLLECSPMGDGAAAVIMCSKEAAKKLGVAKTITLAASTLKSGIVEVEPTDMTFEDITWRAAKEAYEMSGYGPKDIDLTEVHDCFSAAEILRLEGLGLVPRGEGGRWVEQGKTSLGGIIPTNPSGGLLAKGHPLGATGIAQVCEIVWQLRGEAGLRQVEGAKVGLAHCRGGTVVGTEGGACTIQILVR
jgi:acetyl-CoA acetyltransferase